VLYLKGEDKRTGILMKEKKNERKEGRKIIVILTILKLSMP